MIGVVAGGLMGSVLGAVPEISSAASGSNDKRRDPRYHGGGLMGGMIEGAASDRAPV